MTRVSLVRPKVVRSVHYCPATKKVMERKYTDLTSFEAFPTSAIYPTKVTISHFYKNMDNEPFLNIPCKHIVFNAAKLERLDFIPYFCFFKLNITSS